MSRQEMTWQKNQSLKECVLQALADFYIVRKSKTQKVDFTLTNIFIGEGVVSWLQIATN